MKWMTRASAPAARAARAASLTSPSSSGVTTPARGVDPLRHLETALARHDGLEAAEHAPRVGPGAAAELQRVAEAPGGDEGAAHPLALQHRVGADGGAVDHRLEAVRRRAEGGEARHEPVRLVCGRRRHLGDAHAAGGLIHQQQVGERAADVDPEAASGRRLAHAPPPAPSPGAGRPRPSSASRISSSAIRSRR